MLCSSQWIEIFMLTLRDSHFRSLQSIDCCQSVVIYPQKGVLGGGGGGRLGMRERINA